MADRCCVCGRELTQWDWEHGTMIIDEWEDPYTDEVEIKIYCSNCYNDLFEDQEETLLDEEEF